MSDSTVIETTPQPVKLSQLTQELTLNAVWDGRHEEGLDIFVNGERPAPPDTGIIRSARPCLFKVDGEAGDTIGELLEACQMDVDRWKHADVHAFREPPPVVDAWMQRLAYVIGNNGRLKTFLKGLTELSEKISGSPALQHHFPTHRESLGRYLARGYESLPLEPALSLACGAERMLMPDRPGTIASDVLYLWVKDLAEAKVLQEDRDRYRALMEDRDESFPYVDWQRRSPVAKKLLSDELLLHPTLIRNIKFKTNAEPGFDDLSVFGDVLKALGDRQREMVVAAPMPIHELFCMGGMLTAYELKGMAESDPFKLFTVATNYRRMVQLLDGWRLMMFEAEGRNSYAGGHVEEISAKVDADALRGRIEAYDIRAEVAIQAVSDVMKSPDRSPAVNPHHRALIQGGLKSFNVFPSTMRRGSNSITVHI